MLAFLTNLNFTEMAVILIGAVLVFGKDLPKVVMRGLQQLAKLRKAVSEMWREAGLEQEFKRVKAELDPEISELKSARKALDQGKSLLSGPVAHWRKNIGLELEDVVEVDASVVEDAAPAGGDAALESRSEADADDSAEVDAGATSDPETPDPKTHEVEDGGPPAPKDSKDSKGSDAGPQSK